MGKLSVAFGPLCLVGSLGCFGGGGQLQDGLPEDEYPGTYEYVYENNTELLVENHFIVLGGGNGNLRGWYYGTTDEFDIGREGYYPGFFVSEMLGLTFLEGRVSFSLRLSSDLCFTQPVPLHHRSADEVPSDQFQRWEGPTGPTPKLIRYEGLMTEDGIVLEARSGTRRFNRMDR